MAVFACFSEKLLESFDYTTPFEFCRKGGSLFPHLPTHLCIFDQSFHPIEKLCLIPHQVACPAGLDNFGMSTDSKGNDR
jgi:hypothetical protein